MVENIKIFETRLIMAENLWEFYFGKNFENSDRK